MIKIYNQSIQNLNLSTLTPVINNDMACLPKEIFYNIDFMSKLVSSDIYSKVLSRLHLFIIVFTILFCISFIYIFLNKEFKFKNHIISFLISFTPLVLIGVISTSSIIQLLLDSKNYLFILSVFGMTDLLCMWLYIQISIKSWGKLLMRWINEKYKKI